MEGFIFEFGEVVPLSFPRKQESINWKYMDNIQIKFGMVLAFLFFVGCATPSEFYRPFAGISGARKDRGTLILIFNKHKDWPQETKENFIKGELQLGMTKGEVLYLQGMQLGWSRHKLENDVYESWSWSAATSYYDTCDFKNGILVGYYAVDGKYFSTSGVDDVRNYI